MTTTNNESNVCPHCGQVYMSSDEAADCRCGGAAMVRKAERRKARMQRAVERLFGEGCEKINPAFSPIPTPAFRLLYGLADNICAPEYAGEITVIQVQAKLSDGSTAIVKPYTVARKMAVECAVDGEEDEGDEILES